MHRKTILQARDDLKNKKYSACELLEAIYSRIDSVEEKVRSYIHLSKELALEQAKEADARIASGNDAPLLGIPIALKDLICTKGSRTTCGSKILDNFVSPYDATVVKKLKEAGAVIIGKTNMDEFAMGSTTESSAYYPTANPWDLSRTPGGSSGGSAAAVAANECIAALGSDTGGSIRQPASFCGVTGLKPTYGRVSRFGLVAFASSFDQIGPVTKTVADAAYLSGIICGNDPMDSTSANVSVPDFMAGLEKNVKGLKVGLPKEYFSSGVDPEVLESVQNSVKELEKLGVEPVEIELPHTQYAVATYYILACAEASANLSRFDGVKYGFRSESSGDLNKMYTNTRQEGFGDEVKRRIILGAFALSSGYYDAYYIKGQKVRTLIKKDFDQAFEKCDFIAGPNSPVPAFKLNEKLNDPLQMYLSDIFTLSVNLAGLPGMSIPCGFTSQNLPVGLQLIGRPFDEETILNIGNQFQKETDFHKKFPNL
jgi:aspartyl-tRNA(Asn)/glutamyl-tRNA(Gln) amidotransferase subunit A